jgi:GT2 family glycosyltransferase
VLDAFAAYDINIIISDNNSHDNTESVVKKYQKEYRNLWYYKNQENIGLDRNILNVMEYARSKYVLLLGDDDIVDKNFMPAIQPFLYRDYAFIVLSTDKTYTKTEEYCDYNKAFDFL